MKELISVTSTHGAEYATRRMSDVSPESARTNRSAAGGGAPSSDIPPVFLVFGVRYLVRRCVLS